MFFNDFVNILAGQVQRCKHKLMFKQSSSTNFCSLIMLPWKKAWNVRFFHFPSFQAKKSLERRCCVNCECGIVLSVFNEA